MMNTLDQQIDYLRKQLGIRDSQVLNDLLNCYSNAQVSLQNQLVKQQQRIDKAIEDMKEVRYRNNFDDDYVIDSSILTYWINILEGEDKE